LEEAKNRTGFQSYIIEKDWWVVQTLRLISKMDIAEQMVFRGGTSLSKAYKTIVAHRERFTKISGVDYTSHFPPTLNPIPPSEIMEKWKEDYEKVQLNMIVGESPEFEELIDEIKRLTERINNEKM